MNCPDCNSDRYCALKRPTKLDYRQYQCRRCCKYYNERSGTPYNYLTYPTDVVLLAIFYYCHFKNSLVDVTEHMALRGFSVSHETVRLWVQRLGTDVAKKLRIGRRGKCGTDWLMDITYLWIEGRWCYLYRAMIKRVT